MSGQPSYFQEELAHLRDLGREFARTHPGIAPHLGGDATDPDVERLLEGFAFLTARVRQKLDDDLPEITHALLDWLWPGFLRPIPSLTIVQFTPTAQAREAVRVERGAMLESAAVDGTRCRFRTAYAVEVTPLRVAALSLTPEGGGCVRLRFDVPEGASVQQLALGRLRLHLAGDASAARWLRRCLLGAPRRVSVSVEPGGEPIPLPGDAIQSVGFARDQALLPDAPASLPALRLLQEYFSFPEKFLFVDLVGLDRIPALAAARSFTVQIHLDRIPDGAPSLSAADVALNCTPAINLFACDGDPIRLDHRRGEYRLRAAGLDPAHAEIYSVDRVISTARGGDARAYAPLYDRSRHGTSTAARYQLRRRPAFGGDGSDLAIAIAADAVTAGETLSLSLTCTNRGLPATLGVGDLRLPGVGAPSSVRFQNILRPTAPLAAPLDGDTNWLLLSHVTTSIESLLDADALSRLLDLHDRTRPPRDRGIAAVRGSRATRMVDGLPIRGLAIELTLRDGRSADESHLLVSLIDELFSQLVSLNSFSQLTVLQPDGGVCDRRAPRLGARIVL